MVSWPVSHDERMKAPRLDAKECANSGLSDHNFGVLDSRLITAPIQRKPRNVPYLVGTDADCARVPLTLMAAQVIAESLD